MKWRMTKEESFDFQTMKSIAKFWFPFPRAQARGFTLTEYVITLAMFGVVSAGIMGACLYGGRMQVLVSTKLSASDQGRALLGTFVHDVRTAASVKVGDGDAAHFNPATVNAPRSGSARTIYPTSLTNNFILYYRDAADQA